MSGGERDPLWFKDAVIYQVHVKSFFDSNDDGIGDFRGLIDKLDYIVELGANTLWLLPFYPSPRRDDGYDISQYEAVHPDYGDMDDVREFIEKAHARGLRVITELVINHTSDQHPWFQRARRAPRGSAERDFYVWSDSDQDYSGTRIIFCDTEKSNWTWDAEAGQFFWHRFYSHQPDLNFDNPAVLDAVLSVMHFWLEMGVDGLRLDAVPYLIEREGTSNENLPETHDILRRIRAEVDAHFPDRLLLAEANMWPEDTQEYFGNGDECHMAFHFPLMPRMYMAIAREDRFPISDIIRQTPDIPANCQWAIFLRNHDELTLEMVTDSERDYLWQTYAADRRARINLGIRRRLAPLLERDRRRIELMTSLLLTMPGTPVLYYGDELGMGDNIHLGDRDGVRTPMQWSIDRNGGFSRADPAQMVLPPIMDPMYGFQTVNVETQHRDRHSLLNWNRRMLAVRARHQAFGRGELHLLYPRNRHILAYLREHEGEVMLCVANLSRRLQAVELDLSRFERRVPVELLGGTPFPPIGQLSYLLTLPAYGFYAFQLVSESHLPDWHNPAPQPMPEFQTLVTRGSLASEVAGDSHRATLEREVLPTYLSRRRWYAGGEQLPETVRIGWTAALPEAGGDVLLSCVEVPADGSVQRYLLPLGIAWEAPDLPALPQQLALARVRRGPRVGFLTDAFAVPELAASLLEGLRQQRRISLDEGEIRFEPTAAFQSTDFGAADQVRWLGAEQTNSSLVIGDVAVLKLLRRLATGIHPEAEVGRRLGEAGFENTAPMLGEIVHVDGRGQPTTLAVLQGYIQNQGDAWQWTLDHLRRSFDDWQLLPVSDPGREEILASYDSFAEAIGTRLAELHLALARSTDDAAFAPGTAPAEAAQAWADGARTQLDLAFAALQRPDRSHSGDPASIERLQAMREPAMQLVQRLAEAAPGAHVSRVHGDFHLGQILVAQGDAYLIDFEGEPARGADERRAKGSPLRDVAGLLRSLDYAVAVIARSDEGVVQHSDEALHAFLASFRRRAAGRFLQAYRSRAARDDAGWVAPDTMLPLVQLFLIEKAAYEVHYEAAHRPAWIEVPASGLLRLFERLLESDGPQQDIDDV